MGIATSDIARRRSDRLLAPLRICVTGFDASGYPFEEETVTVSVNKHGACVSLTQLLTPNQRLEIKNLANGIAEEFRVVRAMQQVFGPRREWGVEALHPQSKIWGVEFTVPPEHAEAKALMGCTACGKVQLSPLRSQEYAVLLSMGQISRHCDACDQTTRWQPSEEHPASGVAPVEPAPAPAEVERRKHRRIKLTMLLRVRNARGEAETVQTGDVSLSGLCFLSKRTYQVGEEIRLALPGSESQAAKGTRGIIVRSQNRPGGQVYGVCYLPENLERGVRPAGNRFPRMSEDRSAAGMD